VLYSEQFDNVAWLLGNVTTTANTAISPDGTQNADTLIDNSTNNLHYCYQNVSTSAGSHTFSFYAKANTLSHCGIRLYDGTPYDSAIFNLSNGTKGSGDGEIESVGNGWYRVSFTKTLVAGTTYFNIFLSNGTTYTYSGSNQSIYIWGAQYEASSYFTSYIPTTSASATRVADACLTASVTSLIGQSEGVLFVDFNKTASLANSFFILSNIAGTTVGSYQNSIYIYPIENSALACDGFVGNVSQFGFYLSPLSIGRHKIALAYKVNDFAIYVDGVLAGTDTSGTVPQMNYLTIGGGADVGGQSQSVNQVALFKTKLTNADLIALTTI
jgi:hypothetical protein